LKAEKLAKQKVVHDMNISALGAHLKEKIAEREKKERELVQAQADTEELHNMITVTQASKLIKAGNEAIREHTSRGRDLAVKEKFYKEFSSLAPSALKLIQNIDAERNLLRTASLQEESLRDKLVEQQAQHTASTVEMENLQRQIKIKQEKRERLLSRQQQLTDSITAEEASIEAEKNVFLAQIEDKDKEVQRCTAEIQQLQTQYLQDQEEHKKNMTAMKENYQDVSDFLEAYHSDLAIQNAGLHKQISKMVEPSPNLPR